MRIVKCVFGLSLALMAIGFQSCESAARPENRNGHDLWLGDITSPVFAANKELLKNYDSVLGDEGFRIRKNA